MTSNIYVDCTFPDNVRTFPSTLSIKRRIFFRSVSSLGPGNFDAKEVSKSSLSSSSVKSAMEPLSSDMTVPGARGRVARMHSSDLPVR